LPRCRPAGSPISKRTSRRVSGAIARSICTARSCTDICCRGSGRLALITTDDVVQVSRDLHDEGLSPWTIKRILGALSCVFTFAVRRGYTAAHPVHRLERDERPHPLHSEQRVLTQTELARHQLARGRRGLPPHRIAPKTRASVREIPLLPQLAAVLQQHKRVSPFTASTDYVFATSVGTPSLHHNVSKRVLRRAATGAALDLPGRRVRFHDLRRTRSPAT
jgi:integrase